MSKLTKAHTGFMQLLVSGPLSRKNLPPVIDREEDRGRQALRKAGLTVYVDGVGWDITPAGREALSSLKGGE